MDNLEKYALIAAAAAIFLWPKIAAFLQSKAPTHDAKGSAQVTTSRTVGSDRAEWLNDLLNMQRILKANNQPKAADLLSQAMVIIVGAEDTQK